MKVLFAVSNENISTQIVKRYQKEYKEIISYKNMYYFNAIIKELQRDKSYDRIIISEDLEPFANNNLDAIEKFIFEKLDNISDEATGINGEEIPIILLATDTRMKSDSLLVKLFGIGIYNVLLGQDRTTDNVCKLLNKPRNKKDAKIYYKIEVEDVKYKSESEANVNEAEIKNILNYYRKLGKDEDRYVESFNNIAAQYNDAQLRIITKFLPLNVKAVLEEKSHKYQSVMTFDVTSTSELMKKKEQENGLKVGFLNYSNANKLTKPVIVPTAVKKVATKKYENNNKMVESKTEETKNNLETEKLQNSNTFEDTSDLLSEFNDVLETTEKVQIPQNDVTEPTKRGRGRPKKIITEVENKNENVIKRERGRPRKIVEETNVQEIKSLQELDKEQENDIFSDFNEIETQKNVNIAKQEKTVLQGFDDAEEQEDELLPGFDDAEEQEDDTLPGFDDVEEQEDDTLPGFDDVEEQEDDLLPGFDDAEEQEDDTLPGFDDAEEQDDDVLPGFDKIGPKEEGALPGFDDIEEQEEDTLPGFEKNQYNNRLFGEFDNTKINNTLPEFKVNDNINNEFVSNNNLPNLLLKDRKIVTFVGTTKNGTSFLVNNLAKTLASTGIKTAILDLTANRNSYYIYTKNEERLRNIAYESIKKLVNGIAEGISVNQYLDVFTALPDDKLPLEYANEIISTLAQKYSVVLIDCDFNTPIQYFKIAQEIYIVQSMDILTIQPMTAFLRDLKAKEILKDSKVRIIINKLMNVKGLTTKVIIGGLAFYNDPSMSFMTELFNKDLVKYWTVPFDIEACSKYLEGVADCEIKINAYPKKFNEKLKELANVVYPLIGNKKKKNENYSTYNNFSSNMNNTLEQMKNKY